MANDIINDARKVAYLTATYPKKSLQQILEMFNTWPAINKDCAVWEAVSQGWVEVSKKGGNITLTADEVPVPHVDELITIIQSRLLYWMKHQAAMERDLDDSVMVELIAGFPVHDLIIAINLMLDDLIIENYTITEGKKGENVYTVWTLPENRSKEWGRKHFKPTAINLTVADKNELTLD